MLGDQPNPSETFERALAPEPTKDLPLTWDEGRYRYFRVEDAAESYPTVDGEPAKNPGESRLSLALSDLRSKNVRVLDYKRVSYTRDGAPLCDWVIKTMVPRE